MLALAAAAGVLAEVGGDNPTLFVMFFLSFFLSFVRFTGPPHEPRLLLFLTPLLCFCFCFWLDSSMRPEEPFVEVMLPHSNPVPKFEQGILYTTMGGKPRTFVKTGGGGEP